MVTHTIALDSDIQHCRMHKRRREYCATVVQHVKTVKPEVTVQDEAVFTRSDQT